MGVSDKLWDALMTVIKMNDRVMAMSVQMQTQQYKIEDLTTRVIRLETTLEIALATKGIGRIEKR
jgi:hypothetical protein